MRNVLDEFNDINDARIFAENIIATIREPLLVLDCDQRVVFANNSFYRQFQVSKEESVGVLVYRLGNGQWNIPKLREALVKIMSQNSHFDSYEVEHDFPHIGHKIMLLNGRQVKQEGGRNNFILLAIEDVSDRVMAKRKLQESEEKFRGFVQTINSVIFRFNCEGKITFLNTFAEKIFGYKEQEVLGKTVVGTILPEKDEEGKDFRGIVRDILSNPEQYYLKQMEGKCKDASKVWFQWSAKAIRDEHGDVVEILVDGNDITGEMKYRRMLQEMRGLTESSPDIMARFDSAMRLVYGNPLFINMLGRSRDDVVGKTVREIGLPEDNAATLEDALQKAKGEKDRLKTVIQLKGREYHIQVVPEDERIQSFKVYGADITDRKKMEDILRRNEYELRTLVDNSPDIIFRLNCQLRYTYVNPAYERITGITKERFIGKTNSQLGMTRQMAEFWQSAAWEVLESGKEHLVKFEMSSFFGRRYFSARLIPEFEKSGLVETVLVIARDITAQKHAEEEIASLKR